MKIVTFEDYCEEYLDLHVDLMNNKEIKEARESYIDLIKEKKSAADIEKHEKALAKAKELRKLAKFYGGKALSGTAAQKKWAEEIRQKVLESSALVNEQKAQLVKIGGALNTAKFWINNKEKSDSSFNPKAILDEDRKINELYEKHYDALRSNFVCDIERAKKEIYDALSSCSIEIKYDFIKCDFYDCFDVLKKGLKFRV